jgi:hypothetical protein
LEVAQSTANSSSHLAVCAIVLASIQALALINVCSLLSRRGARALLPFGLHTTAALVAALSVVAGFYYGPVACLVSPGSCHAVQATTLCSLLLLLLCVMRMCMDPAEGTARYVLYSASAMLLLVGFAVCAAVTGAEVQAEYADVSARWDQISLVMPPSW